VLLDYDGMYVPTMKGQDASELGSPVYRHPARTIRDFNKRMDDFSLIILLLELRILSANPQSYRGIGESLFLTQEDIRLAAMPKLAALLDLKAETGALNLLHQLETSLQPRAAKLVSLPELLLRYLRKTPVPSRKSVRTQNVKIPEPEMIYVQGGVFYMGNDQYDSSTYRAHKVSLSDYYIAKTQVTFAEYDLFCAATGAKKPDDNGWGRNKYPVINVSWYDAVEYCNWLSVQHGFTPAYSIDKTRKAGYDLNERDLNKWIVTPIIGATGYRLPTEAEWEYAARGGNHSLGYEYAGSNNLDEVGWYEDNSGDQTHPVARKKHNELGLYDMSGNVCEWCWDLYESEYYNWCNTRGIVQNPTGPRSYSEGRVLRGGSWFNTIDDCRPTDRFRENPAVKEYDAGFRLARHLK
jgi:formylglycine-generating enzyme required for sulfatase activity